MDEIDWKKADEIWDIAKANTARQYAETENKLLKKKLEAAIIQRNNMIAQYCDGAANSCYREHVRTCDENLEKIK